MNKQEIFDGLWTITKEKYDACKAEIASVGENHPTERGILQLKAGIYNVAVAAGFCCGSDKAIELMSKRFKNLIKCFPNLAGYYHGLSEEEKGIMEISLYPEVFMRANFYNTYNKDLVEAEKYGDPEKAFKPRIKKEVLDEMLSMWRNFRLQSNLFTFAFEDKEGSVKNERM